MDNGFDNLYRRKILRLNRCKSLQPVQIIAIGAKHCAATIIKFLNFQIIEFLNFTIFAI